MELEIPVRAKFRACLLVNTATLLWAGNVVLGRSLRGVAGPMFLAAVRSAVAAVLFLGLLHWWSRRARHAPVGAGTRWKLMVMALSGVVGFQVLQYWGLRYTTAVNAGLINATGPLMTLLVVRWSREGRVTWWAGFASLLSLAGVAVILGVGDKLVLGPTAVNRGDLLVLGAVGLWVVYSVVGRQVTRELPTVPATAYSTMIAVMPLLLMAGVESATIPPSPTATLLFALLYIGAGPSFIAFLAWNEGVRRLGPSGAMGFYNTLPLYAAILSTVFLGEKLTASQLGGGAMIVAGCLLAILERRREA